jgi:hypothetical protein
VYIFFSADMVVLCVLPRAPAMSTKRGSTFHPLALMSSIRPSYFTVFSSILSSKYLLLLYVNSMNCTVSVGLGWFGGFALYGWLRMQSISSLNLALHWHLCIWLLQVHGNSHCGIVFSSACPSVFPAFIRM